MEETLQLLSFFVSFLFGFFFHMASNFHFKISDSYPLFLKYITTFLFLLNAVLLYILLLYNLNGGVFHVYFLGCVFLGFFLFPVLQKHVKFKDFLSRVIAKYFRR